MLKVAPFAGAWIEMYSDWSGCQEEFCRSLCGSVD